MQSLRASFQYIGFEGALLVTASTPLILVCASAGSSMPSRWLAVSAACTVVAWIFSTFLLMRRTIFGKIFGGLALVGSAACAFPYIVVHPSAALIGAVMLISAGVALVQFSVRREKGWSSTHRDRCLQRARWSAAAVPLLVVAAVMVVPQGHILADGAIAAAAIISQVLVLHWLWSRQWHFRLLLRGALSAAALTGIIGAFLGGHIRLAAIVISVLMFLVLPRSTQFVIKEEHWWEPLLNNPARLLLSSFLGLCIVGTLLLQLPGASSKNVVGLVDAAFTSVSAVCVTGLIVLDTPTDFSLFGQALILLLIQLGGLGIMSITTVALHAMGRRLSLRHERLLTTITDTNHQDLVASLAVILRFTFAAEAVGALLLSALFFMAGDSLWPALWRGLFTAISAFCNAGFALQSDSLVSYQRNPLILHVVAVLIIFGGIAPATSLILPRWIRKRPVPIAAGITLITTITLLVSGALFVLIFEWDGALAGLAVADKMHNAWFQSVTLRTAGFNSVNISGVISPTFLIMLGFMFIGGSPGSTAGGVKTTTVGILVMTFWANVTGRAEVIARNRRISPATINRAVTIIGSGIFVWFLIVLMLEMTQQIPARDIIFEATSALGTVGLSTGATGLLDGIGKIIVILAMFIGRIGPMTLFMLLSEERPAIQTRCLDAHITLT